MKKVLILFHPLKEAVKYIQNEEDAQLAPHHFWLFDKLVEQGYQVDFVDANPKTLLNRIGDRLRLNFLQQQVDALMKVNDYDLVFTPFIEYSFLLSFFKLIKVFKTPLVVIAHHPFYQERKNFFKKKYYDSVRYVYFKGVDSILFYSPAILERSNQGRIKGNCSLVNNFGIDYDFFDSFASNQTLLPSSDYVFSTGGNKRDFDTLIKAFDGIDFNLKITTIGGDSSKQVTCKIPPNVSIDNSLSFGLGSTGKIRKEYYNSLAIAVPLKKMDSYLFETFGITVVLEGMAMGKPIVSTYNDAYTFNLEKEKIGFYIDYEDVQGWRQAINYLIDHPGEAKEMGERARHLSLSKYNYNLFSQKAIAEIDKMLNVKREPVAMAMENW